MTGESLIDLPELMSSRDCQLVVEVCMSGALSVLPEGAISIGCCSSPSRLAEGVANQHVQVVRSALGLMHTAIVVIKPGHQGSRKHIH